MTLCTFNRFTLHCCDNANNTVGLTVRTLLPRLCVSFSCIVGKRMRFLISETKLSRSTKSKETNATINYYRGISLLSITGKPFSCVICRRLKHLAKRILPESQCGFRSKRSAFGMIFALKQTQE